MDDRYPAFDLVAGDVLLLRHVFLQIAFDVLEGCYVPEHLLVLGFESLYVLKDDEVVQFLVHQIG